MQKTIHLFAVICFLFSESVLAFKLPDSFLAEYRLEKYNTTVAEMSLQLSQRDQHFIYQSITHPYGFAALFSSDQVIETSRLIHSSRLNHPLLSQYKFKRKKKTNKNQAIDLFWSNSDAVDIRGIYGKNEFQLLHQGALWDRLSVQLALADDIRRSANMPDGHVFNYSVIDRGKIKPYRFSFVSREKLTLGKNTYTTVQLRREHTSGKKVTLMWLAQELDFIPVKVEQFKKGKLHMGMELSQFKRLKP